MKKQKILAIIPARGGSKRIPKKNIKEFSGKPMIAWPILELKSSNLFCDILVSSDDQEIREIATAFEAIAPFSRPRNLSDDFTGTSAVTKHALEWYIENKIKPDLVVTVYPTAVFLSKNDLKKALKLREKSGSEIVFSATEYAFPIQRAFFVNEKQEIQMFEPEKYSERSQDLQKAYHDAGQFYLATTKAVLDETQAFSNYSSPLIIPRYRAVDIDTKEDFELAEKLFILNKRTS